MFQGLTPTSMRIMLISHIQREAVSFIKAPSQTITLKKIYLGRNN